MNYGGSDHVVKKTEGPTGEWMRGAESGGGAKKGAKLRREAGSIVYKVSRGSACVVYVSFVRAPYVRVT